MIAAALSLLNVDVLRRYATVRRSALLLSLAASVGVIVLGVLQSIVLAVALSVLLFSVGAGGRTAQCSAASTAWTGGTAWTRFPTPAKSPMSSSTAGEAPLFFANAGAFRELQELAARYGLLHTLDSEHFHPSVETALEAIEHDDR